MKSRAACNIYIMKHLFWTKSRILGREWPHEVVEMRVYRYEAR
ncbi:MAG: hypothetical protein N3G20_06375 [Verrucomicrobiae bacterium]|nr:hypothetical protein [Verrucomicrobiae bacterium]